MGSTVSQPSHADRQVEVLDHPGLAPMTLQQTAADAIVKNGALLTTLKVILDGYRRLNTQLDEARTAHLNAFLAGPHYRDHSAICNLREAIEWTEKVLSKVGEIKTSRVYAYPERESGSKGMILTTQRPLTEGELNQLKWKGGIAVGILPVLMAIGGITIHQLFKGRRQAQSIAKNWEQISLSLARREPSITPSSLSDILREHKSLNLSSTWKQMMQQGPIKTSNTSSSSSPISKVHPLSNTRSIHTIINNGGCLGTCRQL